MDFEVIDFWIDSACGEFFNLVVNDMLVYLCIGYFFISINICNNFGDVCQLYNSK